MRNVRIGIAFGVASVLIGGGMLVACQGYDFEQVTPKAIGTVKEAKPIVGVQKPAKIMLVLDKSGSMKYTTESDSDWGCCQTVDPITNSCTGFNPNASGCKWNALRSLLVRPDGFLESTKDSARHGLAVFPAVDAIGSAACKNGAVLVPVANSAGDTVDAIKSALSPTNLQPNGGTPSGAMLNTVHDDSSFVTEETATKRYVILITDGLPNCNSTISTCTACTNGLDPGTNCGGDKQNCLDAQSLVNAVTNLKKKGVETFVIGFGSAVDNPDAKKVLDDAAIAGGQAQPSGSDTRFYLAENEENLEAILDKIKILLQQCTFSLQEAPSSDKVLEVSISDKQNPGDKTLVRGTDWEFANGLAAVNILEPWCTTLRNAEPDRYTLNFLSVKELE